MEKNCIKMKYYIQAFIKDKLFISLYLFNIIVISLIQLSGLTSFNSDVIASFSQLRITLSCSSAYFLSCFVLSFEYNRKILKLNQSIENSNNKCYLYNLLIFVILDLILTIICSAFNIGLFLSLGVQHYEFIGHIIINLLINVFGISLLGIVMGFSFAQIFKKRIISYMIFAFFMFLSSQFFEKVVELVYNNFFIDLYPIYNVFNIYTPSLDWMPNFLFGYSILSYRIALLSAWILIFAFIMSIKIYHSKISRNIISAVCAVLCIFNIIIYVQPSSKNIMNFSPTEGLSADFWYYNAIEQKKEKENFEVLSYKLDLNITNQLNVIAELEVSENLSEYKFTLYHGYKVNKVYNHNRSSIDFKQEGDYLTVSNNLNTTKFYIEYCGSSTKFYSNKQGMVLPGFFPFYPHPGYKYVYNIDEQTFDKLLLNNEAEFEIAVTGINLNYVFCNLNKQDDMFKGKSNGVTIISGFADSYFVNETEIIYPYLDTYSLTLPSIEQNVIQFINEYQNSDKIKKIIIFPNLNLGNMETVIYDTYITTVDLNNLSELCLIAEINPRKQYLSQLINVYINEKEIYEYILKNAQENEYESDLIVIAMNKAINKLGENEFIQTSSTYLYDNNDERAILEFLYDIYNI